MPELKIKERAAGRWDLVSLGEVMLRLDPGEGRIHTTRNFQVWEGGGEYNVARGLKRCFGLETAVVTALVDNAVGRLVQDLIYQGGVDQSHLVWVKDDGVGRSVRNGLNFTERGFGVRAALGCSDRGHTAVSQLEPGDVDWDVVFGKEGARWFHTGGIFAALSETTPAVAREAMDAARRHGTIVSYDLNYRPSLWKSGNEEDFTAALGFEVEGVDEYLSALDVENFRRMIEQAVKAFPNFRVVATTLRSARTATVNDWGAVCYHDGQLYQAPTRASLEIMDRVGGGDSFASGLIYGFLAGKGPQWAVDCGAAHGALAMTSPGDTTMVTLAEVERVMKGGGARVAR
ncbi:MAG: sugar kinase [Acidobacteria bacterium]|nr:MAG: sugar kinase [Acidobacteriota bacterium]